MARRKRTTPTVLLALVLMAAAGWFLAPDLLDQLNLPAPGQAEQNTAPGGRILVPAGQDAAVAGGWADDAAAAAELGGSIDYGTIDPVTGQRSGVVATLVPAMIAAADDDRLGSPAKSSIRPPGFEELPQRNRARGHLLGRQFGGSGDLPENLVALYQTRANSPVMRDYENAIAAAVEAGETIRYEILPVYTAPDATGAPGEVRLRATGDRGFDLDVTVANTPDAEVDERIPLPASAG